MKNRLLVIALVAIATLFSTIQYAGAFSYNDLENDRYLADLNVYTLQASKIIIWGRVLGEYPDRRGPVVRIQGRGPLVDVSGVKAYHANFVMVGTPCDTCTVTIRRYHIESGRLDNIIAVYQP